MTPAATNFAPARCTSVEVRRQHFLSPAPPPNISISTFSSIFHLSSSHRGPVHLIRQMKNCRILRLENVGYELLGIKAIFRKHWPDLKLCIATATKVRKTRRLAHESSTYLLIESSAALLPLPATECKQCSKMNDELAASETSHRRFPLRDSRHPEFAQIW